MNWKIQTQERDPVAKTTRWVTYRHRDGSKNVALFEKLGPLKKFVKHHCLALGQKCRAVNDATNEHQEIT